ncbi:MAG: LysM peptidoglycan-binding domain-containing protein [Micrococcus sp.]|nr:LysM peptidoglycan-binding domain-containing protein [Micrococcus sp.]
MAAGDTLTKLAEKHGIEGGWQAIHELNADTIDNPDLIFVGQELVLPTR